MAEKRKFQAIKGTRDLLPPETELWNRVEQTAREVFGTFGFGEIRLPIFEPTELFARAVGGETDIVSKEMYSFEDHDLPELSRIRSIVSSRTIAFGDPQRFQDFRLQVEELWQGLKDAIEKNLVGRTPENQRALATVPGLLEECRQHQNELASPNLTKDLERERTQRLAVALDTLRTVLRSISLGDEVSLRPEATASVCRAYIQHGMQQLPQPVKLYYMGPMFRRERPQKGRYRQFYQIGAEVLEAARPDPTKDRKKETIRDAATDAEVIGMLMTFFDRSGLYGATLYINSIGCRDCRPAYVNLLRSELLKVRDKLGSDSQRRIETNPLRVLDSKLEHEQPIIEQLPRIGAHLCEECRSHDSEMKRQLELLGVAFKENWRLVRGLDYYMRTTFEITARGLGSQNAVCGGGRYDGLVELLGGPPTKGIGFAIGEDRLILSLRTGSAQEGTSYDESLPDMSTILQRPDVVVTGTSVETWKRATQLAASLRKRGLFVYLPRPGTNLQRVFDAGHKLGIRVAIVVGEDELKRDDYVIRVLAPLDPTSSRDFRVRTGDVVLYGKIVKLRQDLERALLRLAAGKPDLETRRNISALLDRLVERELLPLKLAGAVKDVLPALNRTIHGESLAADSVQWALAFGNLLLNELEKLSPMEV